MKKDWLVIDAKNADLNRISSFLSRADIFHCTLHGINKVVANCVSRKQYKILAKEFGRENVADELPDANGIDALQKLDHRFTFRHSGVMDVKDQIVSGFVMHGNDFDWKLHGGVRPSIGDSSTYKGTYEGLFHVALDGCVKQLEGEVRINTNGGK